MDKSDQQIAQEFDRYCADAELYREANRHFALITESAQRNEVIILNPALWKDALESAKCANS